MLINIRYSDSLRTAIAKVLYINIDIEIVIVAEDDACELFGMGH